MIWKVKDLIEALGKCDPESYVGHRVTEDEYYMIEAISGVVAREVAPEELGRGFRPCLCKMVIIDEVETAETVARKKLERLVRNE